MKEALLTINTTTEKTIKSYSPNDVFFCPEESQFYSQCIEKMVLNQCDPFDSIVEFGTGDGSPVINCLLKTKFDGAIHGYELSPASYEVAQSRIEQYQLKKHYILHNQCFFKNLASHTRYLIANPPYLPAPDDDLYMPSLHGGIDGATLTKRLLTLNCESVLLMIASYSNPVEIVEHAIAHNYQVADFMISPLNFGYYSCEPKVKNAIAELRRQRKAFYSQNIYFLAGVLFKQKQSTDADLSAEFVKVMTCLADKAAETPDFS